MTAEESEKRSGSGTEKWLNRESLLKKQIKKANTSKEKGGRYTEI